MLPKAHAANIIDFAPNPGLTSYGQLVSAIARNAFVFGAVISLFLLIFGGFQVIVAAGDVKKAEQGRHALTGAVVGLLLIAGSFWIIQIVETITGLPILSPGL